MSSADDEPNSNGGEGTDPASKKRKVQRACDLCRRKKVRCDGPQMSGNRCSNCISLSVDCTYVSEAKKRGPPKGYVENLENRLAKMEDLLRRLAPDVDIEAELEQQLAAAAKASQNDASSSNNAKKGNRRQSTSAPRNRQPDPPSPPSPNSQLTLLRDLSEKVGPCNLVTREDYEEYETSDDDLGTTQLPDIVTDAMRDLSLQNGYLRRFHGKSSGLMLVQAAKDLKKQYSGDSEGSSLRREEFWTPTDWEWELWQDPLTPGNVHFPPPDLTRTLFDLFFRYFTPFLPAIHRGTFEAQYAEGLHYRQTSFAVVVLLVCAIASKFCDDPRVCLENGGPPSAGWKYFVQVKDLKKSLHAPATLADLQAFVLVAYYLQATSAPHSAWTILGIGIRCAQDVGAHRKKVYSGNISLADEQWKRVFWCLVVLDRSVSSALGRPLACQDEDFDLEFPEEVDDEYWGDVGDQGPRQPKGVPSHISYFNCSLRLSQILAFALRTIYTINKSKVLLGFVGPQWEQHIVAELDSAMNKWIDSVPDHLRWDPNRENQIHFEQSAVLYATYYHLHILIHRPFIPSPRKPSVLSFPSLAICTNAARSCSHVVDALGRRSEHVLPSALVAAFTSGIVLLISIWGAKKTGVTMDPNFHMKDVNKCLQFLQKAESDWHSSGRLVDILRELASFGDLPLADLRVTASTSQKRDRSFESSSSGEGTLEPVSPEEDSPRPRRPMPKGKNKATAPSVLQPAPQRVHSSPDSGMSDPGYVSSIDQNQPVTRWPSTSSLSFAPSLPPLPAQTTSSTSPSVPVPAPEQQPWYDSFNASIGLGNGIGDGIGNGVQYDGLSAETTGSNFTIAGAILPSFFPVLDPNFGDTLANVPPQASWNNGGGGGVQAETYIPSGPGPFDNQASMTGQHIPGGGDILQDNGQSSSIPGSTNMNGNGDNQQGFVADAQAFLGGDELGMWQAAPGGFEWEDWGNYLSNMTAVSPIYAPPPTNGRST